MGRPGAPRPEDMRRERQVDAGDAVLAERDLLETEQLGYNRAERSEQKRSAALRVFDGAGMLLLNPDADMKNARPGAAISELVDKLLLPGLHERGGTMRDKCKPGPCR